MKLLISTLLIIMFMALCYDNHQHQQHNNAINDDPPPPKTRTLIANNIKLLNYNLTPHDMAWYTRTIEKESIEFDVPHELIVVVISMESGFNPNAKSKKNAIGSMQVMPRYWKHLPYDLSDKVDNIKAGTHILRHYKDKCGNWKCAVMAYNIGITNYRKGRKLKVGTKYHSKLQNEMAILNDKFEWQS